MSTFVNGRCSLYSFTIGGSVIVHGLAFERDLGLVGVSVQTTASLSFNTQERVCSCLRTSDCTLIFFFLFYFRLFSYQRILSICRLRERCQQIKSFRLVIVKRVCSSVSFNCTLKLWKVICRSCPILFIPKFKRVLKQLLIFCLQILFKI